MIDASAARARLYVRPSAARMLRAVGRGLLALAAGSQERRAIAQLQSLSDQQLKDIGITRAQIEPAVRGMPLHNGGRYAIDGSVR